jgi:TonB-dependent SusC/RagA subfamily outer membrane receptor
MVSTTYNNLSLSLKIAIFILILIAICISPAFSQKLLSPSRQSSYYTYIYKLSPADVLNFYKHPGKDPDENILRHPVDSFKTDKYWENTLPAGNYLRVHASKNKLQYELIENRSAYLQLFRNNYDLRFILTDKQGRMINNATVQFDQKTVPFDNKSGLYRLNASKKDTILKAEFAGVTNYYKIEQEKPYRYNQYNNQSWFKRLWLSFKNIFKKRNSNQQRFANKYQGFMVFNKAMYKPHDTVKFKAYILSKDSKKPINTSRLQVRLKQNYNDDGKIIGKVDSYRAGGFEYSFALSDSLNLDLDENYTISLEDPDKYLPKQKDYDKEDAKHVVYLTGNFRYEEYELKSLTFSTRTDKKEHWPGNPLALYLKAVDENNLPSPDGRVTITLTTRNANEFNTNHVFVPDTLWKHQQALDPVGETKVLFPDSIFPKASIDYDIDAEFLNSNNESQSADKKASFKYKHFNIAASLSADTLISTCQEFGKDIKAHAIIAALDAKDDTIEVQHVNLPAKIIINPNAASYNITTDSTDTDLELKELGSDVSLSGYRTADSLFVKVANPRNLHFWYSVFAGNKLIDGGEAVQLLYKRAYHEQNNVAFLINYIWAGQSRTDQSVVPYQDKLLTINVKQPVSVYPGQQVKTDIVVTDATGKPVPNTDLTAWAMTSKFTNYNLPFVPYMGKLYPGRKIKNPFTDKDIDGHGNLKLNWSRWSREMGLDSITYHQFTHPAKQYQVEEPTTDTLAQVAPFIVKDGDIIPVHILYIDNRPVYFDQAQQLQRYSFLVNPGLHSFQFRTSKQLINVDSILVKKAEKLILSINADKARSVKVTDTLTAYEADVLNKYMVTVVNNFGSRMATLEQPDKIMLLNPNPGYHNDILAGPLADNYAQLSVRGEKSRYFVAEPGYTFLFEPGLLKQKSIPYKYPFNKTLSAASGTDDYTQFVLTKLQTDSLWQQYLDRRANTQSLFSNDDNKSIRTAHLIMNISQPKDKKLLIKNVIMYRYNDPEFIRIYPGNTTDLYRIEAGNYRLLFLLQGDVYDLKENISIKPYGINFYKLHILPSHVKDSVSIRISNIINNRNGQYDYKDKDIENDALKIKEAFNEKYLDMSDFTGQMGGVITDNSDKKPIPGVTVKVKGTNTGTQTDVNGRFKLKVPSHGKLIVSFIGYDTREINIVPGAYEKIVLKESSKALQEVVVVGYSVQKKANLSYSVSTVLQGQVAGISVSDPGANGAIRIRGVSSAPGQAPLYVIDGEIVTNINGIAPDSIADISILKAAAATALYGSRAANGVVVITTKKKPGDAQSAEAVQPGNEATIRKNFSDYAYWQPKLTTDAQGKASFTTTYPDDITSWRTFIIGINGQQTGFKEAQIKSFKPLSANFTSPQFAVAGDELSVIGKVLNYNSQTADVNRSFSYNGKLLKQENISVKNSRIDTLNIIADAVDSLSFGYTIKRDNGYFDGERRKIPVVKQGIEETKGIFEVLNGDTTARLKFDPALGLVTLHAENSVLPALMEETRKLRDYKYLCNEQLASKLKGLLTEKRIKKFMSEEFKYGKNITEVIKKLQENRKSTGTWGWWKDTDEELWISLHAVEALLDAQKEGYTIQLDKQKLTDYLTYQLDSYYGQDKLFCMQLLHQLGAKVDYKRYFDVIAKENNTIKFKTGINVNTYYKFRLLLLKQEMGIPIKLDSLLASQHHTLFGNTYWGDNSYRFFDNSVQLSVLAYKIIRNDGNHPDMLNKIRGYFLEQRGHGDWRNTYEAAMILENILPDLLMEGKSIKPASLTIKGSKTETISQFPYTAKLTDNEISISKTGTLPVYITGYQQFWNPKPQKVNKDFTVDTWFEKNGNKASQLKGGEAITLKAEITAKGDADFVMIEIPIPAGCSYNSKEQSWDNNEVHREYFKEKVSIFCRKLKQGKYTYTINLMPRFDGRYNLNPAKAEMMYFPVFYGREGMKKVVIGSQGN